MFFYRERSGGGHYVFVSDNLCIVVEPLTETIIRTFPRRVIPNNALDSLKFATVLSCLVDKANQSVRVTQFSRSGRVSVEPVSLKSFRDKESSWFKRSDYRFRFTIDLPIRGKSFKQVIYVMEE